MDVDKIKSACSETLIMSLLKEGNIVCLYPEASRTHDGKIADIKPGFSLLSRRTKASVVPVVIEGAFEAWPRHAKFPKPKKVLMMCGPVITAEKIKELGDVEFAKHMTSEYHRMQNELRAKMGREPINYS